MGFSLPEEGVAREAAETRYDEMKDLVLRELKSHLSPELLGRLDQVIVYAPLQKKDLVRIAELHIQELAKRLVGKKITIDVSKGVLEEIAQRSVSRDEGARAIRSVVQELLEDPIAVSVINEDASAGRSFVARKAGGKVTVTTK